MRQFAFILVFICHIPMGSYAQDIDLNFLRLNYDKAVANMELCDKMIKGAESKKSSPVYLAYLGALQAVWANHVGSPISKLKTFNKGEENIEQAVALAPNNIEIRLLRYSIQSNVPRILNYNKQIEEDLDFIKKNKEKANSQALLQLINRHNI